MDSNNPAASTTAAQPAQPDVNTALGKVAGKTASSQSKLATLLKVHRKLAIVLLLPVIAWCLSGLTHPLVAHFFTTEAARTAQPLTPLPAFSEANALSPQRAVSISGFETIDNIQIVSLGDRFFYQLGQRFQTPAATQAISEWREAAPWPFWQFSYVPLDYHPANNTKIAVNASNVDNNRLSDMHHHQYAESLARFYAGDDDSPIASITTLSEYDAFYTSINRRLPVERVIFDRGDGLTVYIDPLTGELAAVSDQKRDVLLWIFRNLHTWDFLAERHHPVRVAVLQTLIALTLIMGISGLVLYTVMYKKLYRNGKGRGGNARVHRLMGIVIALPLIGFATSGLHVVSSKYTPEHHFAYQPDLGFTTDELTLNPLAATNTMDAYQISLARLNGEPHWQLLTHSDDGKTIQYLTMQGDVVEGGDTQYATQIANNVSGLPTDAIKGTQVRHAFGRDYPQVMKRLPVNRIAYGDNNGTRVFVETRTGLVAGMGTQADGLRSLHFMMLHKYRFLNGLGTTNRDLVMTALVLGIVGVCLLGLSMLVRRKFRRGAV
ncbi:Uncharacterised protein [BD1-7 clade bacterium]|uniref:PepSY domain-containing protein n=1 Tax=BD1-7 clade bacterium TaxID=2029982 RepID=A0A5S9PAT8_9GAMM|nr:Uncharacterised protein [BD1-7 clade bacterium]